MERKKASLILGDGTVFEGFSFGADVSAAGEVVFNTAMTGYPESLTDPSYCGQILVLTSPMTGNYGVPPPDVREDGLPLYFESDRIWARGLVVTDYTTGYSHWNAVESLGEWLSRSGVPAICGIDTRELTKHIRSHGVMPGKIVVEGCEKTLEKPLEKTLEKPDTNSTPDFHPVSEVSCREPITYGAATTKKAPQEPTYKATQEPTNATTKPKILLLDCGCKYNIIRCLTSRGATVTRVPWDFDFTSMEYDGLMLGNGPGDPTRCTPAIEHIKRAMERGKPIFGICLGHQLLALAAGAKTYKLKYGHRSHNQPVLLAGTDRAFITSQNHGYAVDPSSLPSGWAPWFTNINDGTNEGIRHLTLPFCSVQFHPEASSGPVDTGGLFDDFITQCTRHQ